MTDLAHLPQALREHGNALGAYGQPLRVMVVLGAIMAACRLTDREEAVLPLFLGVIASGLAETDDSWRGRLRSLLATLACFAVAAASVQLLFGRPPLFIAAVAFAAFALTLLGAVGARYKAIAYGTLILGMYATIAADHAHAAGRAGDAVHWREPLLLLAGAAAYGALSVLWCALFPAQPVQSRLVRLFEVLGDYVRYKASLFEPLRQVDVARKRLALAQLNATVVAELNATKEAIFSRIGPRRPPSTRLARYRGLYLIAQDVHERASSSHEDYNALADAFFHSDLLYRCQRVLAVQGEDCQRLARSIGRREPFGADGRSVQALAELRSAIAHARTLPLAPRAAVLLDSIEALARNLAQLDGQLAGASDAAHPSARLGRADMSLFDRSARTWREALARVRRHLTPRSPLFRHAVRLAAALAAGWAVMQAVHAQQGYWIMLTTLFVCQPAYGDTIARMGQRVAGTVAGVVAAWALIALFPQPAVQAALAVAAGVLFFATRADRYLLATACMTLLVLLAFNQVTDSAALIVPRLVDTAIGSAIAGLAVLLVLPQWQARRLHEVAAQALRHHAAYLRQIARQYRSGPVDDLAYRLARRNAHNSDAAFATAVAEMFREPGFVRPRAGEALRFLIQSHTLLSYLSALGAHRAALAAGRRADGLLDSAGQAALALERLAAVLDGGQPLPPQPEPPEAVAARAATALPDEGEGSASDAVEAPLRLLRTELSLVWMQVDALRSQAAQWLAPAGTDDPEPSAQAPSFSPADPPASAR